MVLDKSNNQVIFDEKDFVSYLVLQSLFYGRPDDVQSCKNRIKFGDKFKYSFNADVVKKAVAFCSSYINCQYDLEG